MTEYSSNSNKSRETATNAPAVPEKKVTKVVTGPVKVKKKSELSKLADIFISEDVSNVKGYIVMEVLVPAIKKAISDIVTDGIDMILYGNSGGRKRSSNSPSYVSYNTISDRRRRDEGSYEKSRGFQIKEVMLNSKAEADEVLNCLDDIIATYKIAKVSDYYDLLGISGDYTDNRYGWTNLANAEVIKSRNGYFIRFPRPLPIDR